MLLILILNGLFPSFTSTISINSPELSRSQGNLKSGRRSLILGGIESRTRPFFVRVNAVYGDGYFCGGALIHSQWVITAAKCVEGVESSQLFAETAGIPSLRQRRYFKVKKIFFLKKHKIYLKIGVDLALLHLQHDVPEEKADTIKVCKEEPALGEVLGACGMGSISNSSFLIPSNLHETFFYESVFRSSDPDDLESCPFGKICTESTDNSHSSLCAMDIGGPLYSFKCGSLEAACLYGVASYYDPPGLFKKGSSLSCNGGSTFTNAVEHRKWIEAVIMAETHEN